MKFLDKLRNSNKKVLSIIIIVILIIVLSISIVVLKNFISIPFISNKKEELPKEHHTETEKDTLKQSDDKNEEKKVYEDKEIEDYGSPTIDINENWKGSINGMRLNIAYDKSNKSFIGIVKNVTNYNIKNISIRINLKKDNKIVATIDDISIKKLSIDDSKAFKINTSNYKEIKENSYDSWSIYAVSKSTTESVIKNTSQEDIY